MVDTGMSHIGFRCTWPAGTDDPTASTPHDGHELWEDHFT
jgi:hypothetical protein